MSPKTKKLCVICECCHYDSPLSSDDFNIFIVDLNGGGGCSKGKGGYVKREPNIRLQGFDHFTYMFCNSGSDLYIIDYGSGDRPVFKYNLDKLVADAPEIIVAKSSEEIIVGGSSFKPHSYMPNPKLDSSIAIPSPDGNILVFSPILDFCGGDDDRFIDEGERMKCQPELYYTKTNSWIQLPQLSIRQIKTETKTSSSSYFEILDGGGSWIKFGKGCIPPRDFQGWGRLFVISSYTFISESTLLVRIMSEFFENVGYLITLDIHQGWKLYEGWNFCEMDPSKFVNEMLIVENRLFLDTLGGIDDHGRDLEFKVSKKWGPNVSSGAIVLTDYVKDKEFCFALATAGPRGGSLNKSYLIVDELEHELSKDKDDGICTPRPRINHFKFVISEMCNYFFINTAFMLPQC